MWGVGNSWSFNQSVQSVVSSFPGEIEGDPFQIKNGWWKMSMKHHTLTLNTYVMAVSVCILWLIQYFANNAHPELFFRWSRPLTRVTGCPHPWTVLWHCTSSCWTAGRRTGQSGPSLTRSLECWIRWSVTPTLWKHQWGHAQGETHRVFFITSIRKQVRSGCATYCTAPIVLLGNNVSKLLLLTWSREHQRFMSYSSPIEISLDSFKITRGTGIMW